MLVCPSRWALSLTSFLGLFLAGFDASAQTAHPAAFDVQLFQPSASPRAIFNVELPSISSHLSVTGSLWGSYANRTLVTLDGDTARPLVRNVLAMEAQAALGLFEYFELGLALPLTSQDSPALTQNGAPGLDTSTLAGSFSVGDLRAYAKVPLLRGATPLAFRMGVSFPTGDREHFNGSASWTFSPVVALSHTFGALTLAANAGLRLHERNAVESLEVNDELTLSLGARLAASRRVALLGEVNTWITLDPSPGRDRQAPAEALLGAQFAFTTGLSATAGVGRGLTAGYGSPDIRGLVGLRLTSERAGGCAFGPEDYDGYQDGDYCADPDNDGDGIPDEGDHCPNDREDRDGFLDTDGCDDPDNDGDGFTDDNDRCPNDPEDFDGFQNDGCPELDNDRDGIPDLLDACVNEPEDPDHYQDEDGCPEPGPDAATVTRTESRLLVNQRIFFDFDSDTIRNVSFPILDEIARTMREQQDILRLRIEGYTDGQGSAEYNTDLSFRRARAVVEYLSGHGLPRDRLEFQGYGSTHPVADDNTPEGQALNRRVEFTITQQAGRAAPTPAAPPPTTPRPRRGHRAH